MTELRYLAPDTLDEAIKAFAAAGSAGRILAGGTDLLVQMRSGAVKPGVIVDIKKIAEMTAIEETADGGFRIGAAVSGAVLRGASALRQGLAGRAGGDQPDRLHPGAGPRLGRAAICATARRPATACRRWSPPAPSSRVQGPNGRREMPVEEVPAGPGRTNLLPGEILVSFTLPPRPKGSSDAYLRMIPRTEMDIAVVGVGVSLTHARTASAPPPASASARWRRPCCWSRPPPRR